MSGDLTPECAAVVAKVLDALSAPGGEEDDRSQAQRYHDALQEAMQRLVTANLVPERAGQPVKVWAHITLADLMRLDGSSALLDEWTAQVRARWAANRAAASEGGEDSGVWLDGDAAEAIACDAAMAPIVTGDVNPDALDDLIRLCVQLDKLRRGGEPRPDTTQAWAAIERAVIGQAVDLLSGAGRARLVPAPPPARRPPRRPQPPARHRLLRDHPGRDPQRGHPARPALPVPRLPPARLRLPGPPRQAQEERRRNQHRGLCPALPFSPPDRHPQMGLEPGPEPRRDDDRVEQGQDQDPPQPRPPGPPGVITPGPVSPA